MAREQETEESFDGTYTVPVEEGTGTEVATRTPRTVEVHYADGTVESVTPEDLRALSFSDLASNFAVTTADEAIGTDQFGPILEDKGRLVGVPFMLVHWEFYNGDHGDFASMWIITPDNERYIVNDGSTGIAAQLRELTAKNGADSMLACKHGFRVSEYTYFGLDGKERPAKTYYIDTKL